MTQKHTGIVTFQLGLFGLNAQAVPVRASSVSKVALKNICPDCLPTAVAPKQLYRCAAGHEHPTGELAKATQVGTGKSATLIPLSEAEQAAVKAAAAGPDYVEGVMEIHVCDAAELESVTLPDDVAYRIRPDAKNEKNYAVLLGMAADTDVALFGVLKVGSGGPRPYRIQVWEGQLVIQSLIRPENIAERDSIEAEANDKLKAMAAMLVEQVKEPFDAALLADARVEALAQVLEAKEDGTPFTPAEQVAATATNDDDSLMAMLEATIAAKRAA